MATASSIEAVAIHSGHVEWNADADRVLVRGSYNREMKTNSTIRLLICLVGLGSECQSPARTRRETQMRETDA